jgi:hypothetical protein
MAGGLLPHSRSLPVRPSAGWDRSMSVTSAWAWSATCAARCPPPGPVCSSVCGSPPGPISSAVYAYEDQHDQHKDAGHELPGAGEVMTRPLEHHRDTGQHYLAPEEELHTATTCHHDTP